MARTRPARDSALIAVFRKEGGAAPDVEEAEASQDEGQEDEEGVEHYRGTQRRSPGFVRADSPKNRRTVTPKRTMKVVMCDSLSEGESAAMGYKKSGRWPKETAKMPRSQCRTAAWKDPDPGVTRLSARRRTGNRPTAR